MNPRMMFSALAVSAAALALSACGNSEPPPPPLQNPSQTTAPVSVIQPAYPPSAPDEILTANTMGHTHGHYTSLQTAEVKGVEACIESAKVATYMKAALDFNQTTYTSCLGRDGKARAIIACAPVKATGAIACRPF